eukprot:3331275-Prymnesium_polylepis.1
MAEAASCPQCKAPALDVQLQGGGASAEAGARLGMRWHGRQKIADDARRWRPISAIGRLPILGWGVAHGERRRGHAEWS